MDSHNSGGSVVCTVLILRDAQNFATLLKQANKQPFPADEDDGVLMTYVHSEETNVSTLVIYDAKTMSDTPLAQVRLPQRVPYGFHTAFVTEAQLKLQD